MIHLPDDATETELADLAAEQRELTKLTGIEGALLPDEKTDGIPRFTF